MKEQLAKIRPDEKDDIYTLHALPENWEHMEYNEFLKARRVMMADVIRMGYERLN
jgi:hypothetical protein